MFSREYRVKNKEKRIVGLRVCVYILCSILFSISSYAQCAMCRAALETEGNAVKSQAVNDGIVYLMVIPYVLVAGIGYYIYRMRKKKA